MLAEIVESRKSAGTVALKGPLTGVLSVGMLARECCWLAALAIPNMSRQMLAPGEAEAAWGEVDTEEPLALLLLGWSVCVARHAVVVGFVFVIVLSPNHLHILRGD